MKKIILFIPILFLSKLIAQPVVLGGSNFCSLGYSSPVYTATSTIGAGNPGAAQIWNFSTVPFTFKGTLSVATESNSTYASNYPAANGLFTVVTGTNTLYSYADTNATRLDLVTDGITTPGTGNDYSPNPLQLLQFPFHYQDSITDTYQKVGGTQNLESLIYDGYGTVILPYNTFYNLVRVKSVRPGVVIYHWYNLNPLAEVLGYNVSNNSLTATNPSLAGINQLSNNNQTLIYPNPAENNFTIDANNVVDVKLFDVLGKQIFATKENQIDVSNFNDGVYFIQVQTTQNITTQKIMVQH